MPKRVGLAVVLMPSAAACRSRAAGDSRGDRAFGRLLGSLVGPPGFADTAQELMVEDLLSSRAFLNWLFFTLRQARTKDEIVISKRLFFFSYHTPLPFRVFLLQNYQKGCLICKLDHILLMSFFVDF